MTPFGFDTSLALSSDRITNTSAAVPGGTVTEALETVASAAAGAAAVAAASAVPHITSNALSTYAVLVSDYYVLLKGVAPVLTLPNGTLHTGKVLVIKDKGGTAAASPITVTPFAGQTIDGAASLTIGGIGGNFASVTLVFAGTDWSVV